MKIELNLSINNMKKNIKRTLYTTVSITLCTILILTTILLISSIKNGIAENIETKYNDYHMILKDLDSTSFNKIKDKEYISKIYMEDDNNLQLKELGKPYSFPNTEDNFNIYIRFNNIKNICNYSNDIIKTLESNSNNFADIESKYAFNQKLLTAYGLIDVGIVRVNGLPTCMPRLNYSYVTDIAILFILIAFSILFIIILYNAFLITLNERKKEYAILHSVGATQNQILKIIFIEAFVIGIIGIIIGSIVSIFNVNIILKLLNYILIPIGYIFRLVFDAKYVFLAICLIFVNIYLSSIIPSIKASTASIIQEIRNNSGIKYNKKKETILEKFLPIEGKLAIKSIRRNRNKYRVITILLTVCMTSYIAFSTYIAYEKQTSEFVSEYDVDATLRLDSISNIDYNSLFNDYEAKYNDKIEFSEYKEMNINVLVEPKEAIITENSVTTYMDEKKGIQLSIIGLDDKTYNSYIKQLNASYGDLIIFNNTIIELFTENDIVRRFTPAFKESENLKLSIIAIGNDFDYENNFIKNWKYEIVDDKSLNVNFVLTDELIQGYKEVKTTHSIPTVFVNMQTYNNINESINNYSVANGFIINKSIHNMDRILKIKCNNIIEFSNYMQNNIEKMRNKDVDGLKIEYYTLENQENLIYINILDLILKVIMIYIVIIGITSSMNIISASICEREFEFEALNNIGATKKQINKILVYECIYIFAYSLILSIILSIPILYLIIRHMKSVIIFNNLLIPFKSICLFFTFLFLISLGISIYLIKTIKK